MPYPGNEGSRWRAGLCLLLAYLLAMAICFRTPVLSGFDLGFGDRIDGLIEIGILEHWRNVLHGAAAWDVTGYFHPYPGTLGYNDGYLLFGLVYSGWRTWFDPYLSDTLNIATFKSIGFFASYALVTRSLRWERPVGLIVALLFTICNAMAIQAVHAQLQTIALLPVTAMLAIGAVRAEAAGRKGRARALGAGVAALVAAWLMTAFYFAWFALFFAVVFVPCWLFVTRRDARAILVLVRAHLGTLAVIGLVFALCVVPFLIVYLPKSAETGGHLYADVLGYLVTPIDPVNVGPDNYLWGWMFRSLGAVIQAALPEDPRFAQRMIGGEHESGFALILFVLIVESAHRVLARGGARFGAPVPSVLRALALAVVVSWALTVQLWLLSPWGAVFWLVPGASGLRVVLRYQIFLVLPALILVAAVHRAQAMALLRRRPWVAGGFAALLVAEQLNGTGAAALSRRRQLADLGAIPPPPAACRSFYAVSIRPHERVYRDAAFDGIRLHNVDAMLLAERWRVPTLGGYATFRPPDWDFADPLRAGYDARVAAYAARHALRGVCRLDVRQPKPWATAIR